MRTNKNKPGKKPFPWTCSQCRQKSLFEAVVDYSVDVGHDGKLYHVQVAGLRTPKCKKCGQVAPDSEANAAITLAFRRLAGLLTPEKIQTNREALKLTQKELAAALGIADVTLARIEDGVQIQQHALDNLLRLFFGVPKARELLTNNRKLSKVGLVLRDKALATA